MGNEKDIRWEQRFSIYNSALKKLSEAIDYIKNDPEKRDYTIEAENAEKVLDEIIKEGLIQRFEYTYEMANEIYLKIIREYHPVFIRFQEVMEEKRSGRQLKLFDQE